MDELQKKNQTSLQISSKTFWLDRINLKNVIKLDRKEARKGKRIDAMVRGLGEDNAIAFLVLMIEKLNRSIAVGNKMVEEDIMEAGVILANEYGWLKVEQLAQFCHYAKTGKLGTFVRFGQTEFFDALNKYSSDTDNQIVEEYLANKEVDDERPQRGNAHKIGTILTEQDLKKMTDGNKGTS